MAEKNKKKGLFSTLLSISPLIVCPISTDPVSVNEHIEDVTWLCNTIYLGVMKNIP